ncbi:MAG: SNF2-related protein [Acidimicrobiales bacterium]|nr:SNF2-related protein [Acidimicrobiales bacterium]
MARRDRSVGAGDDQADLFSVDESALALYRTGADAWPDPNRFPHNRPGQTVRASVRPDLLSSRHPLVVAGFASIGEVVDLVDQWTALDRDDTDRSVRILLGSEPFASHRHSFASSHAAFTDDVRRYWLEERGISIELSAAVLTAIEAIDAGRLSARAFAGAESLHAKVFVGDDASTLGSSNFTRAGLTGNVELNARFERETDRARHDELTRAAENLWEIGTDWTAELRDLLEAMLRVVTWHEALAAACAELLEGEWATRYLDHDTTADGFGLWPSQRLGIAQALWIVENVGSVLVADATGSGKTRMGAHLIRAIRDRLWGTGRVRRDLTVLVCPPAVEEIWRAESVATGLSIDTVSHGLLSRAAAHGDRIERDVVHRAQVLAVDEAHNFLNRDSNRTQQVRDSQADHVALFTATPINRGASDLLQLVGLLGADNFEDRTLAILQRLERRRSVDDQLRADDLEQLQREIQRFTVRRTKATLNGLVDREPDAYLHPDGSRVCRYPVHVSKTYDTGETDDDEAVASRIRSIADDLVGITQLERVVAVPASLRREYTDERWLHLRLTACGGLTRHHVLGAMRSSRAALVEHLAGTDAAVDTFELDRSFKTLGTGRIIDRVGELRNQGPPQVDLDCDLPDWLTDVDAWTQRCDDEERRYREILDSAGTLSTARETAKARVLIDLLDDHERVLSFDHHLITLSVVDGILREHGHRPLVATGSATQIRREVSRRFARTSQSRAVALCSDAMNEGINLQGASAVVHLDLPTTLRVAEQRVGRVDRMDSPHDAIEVWWPEDGPSFATRANELLAQRAAESNALLGANVVLPEALRRATDRDADQPTDVGEHIALVEAKAGEDWDGIRDALDPVRALVADDGTGLVEVGQYDRVRDAPATRTRLCLVRSDEPFAFFSLSANANGAPRWLLLDGTDLDVVDDLVDIGAALRRLLRSDPPTVAVDAGAMRFMTRALERAGIAERSMLPRKMQRALDQMRWACSTWADVARTAGHEAAAARWLALAGAAAGADARQPDLYGLAERWLELVGPMVEEYRATHRRARYVLLRDIDRRLETEPLDLDRVATACSGLLTQTPLAERVRVCILGQPGPVASDDAPATGEPWGMARST